MFACILLMVCVLLVSQYKCDCLKVQATRFAFSNSLSTLVTEEGNGEGCEEGGSFCGTKERHEEGDEEGGSSCSTKEGGSSCSTQVGRRSSHQEDASSESGTFDVGRLRATTLR